VLDMHITTTFTAWCQWNGCAEWVESSDQHRTKRQFQKSLKSWGWTVVDEKTKCSRCVAEEFRHAIESSGYDTWRCSDGSWSLCHKDTDTALRFKDDAELIAFARSKGWRGEG